MRRWELVATRQLSELDKNTTVALEQNVPPPPSLPPHPRIAARAASRQREKDNLGIVVTTTAACMRHNMWNSIHTGMLVVVESVLVCNSSDPKH